MNYLILGLYVLNGTVLYQVIKVISLQRERIRENKQFKDEMLQAKYITINQATKPLLTHISTLESLLEKKEEIIEDDDLNDAIADLRAEIQSLNENNIDKYFMRIPLLDDD